MAAPEYVPVDAGTDARVYKAPLRPRGAWSADRPADLGPGQPRGPRFGSPGPDQGFALNLAEGLADRVVLAPGEHVADALSGAVAVATKRSSLLGRAPVVHDVIIGLIVWGFLDDEADPALIEERRARFAEIAHHHRYAARRAVADAVSAEVLAWTVDEVTSAHRGDWRSLLDL